VKSLRIQKKLSSRDTSRGFSLVEIMVALTIGAILVAGIVQYFQGNRQTERLNLALARIQDNGRFGLEIIKNDFQLVGHMGCARYQDLAAGDPADEGNRGFISEGFPIGNVDNVFWPHPQTMTDTGAVDGFHNNITFTLPGERDQDLDGTVDAVQFTINNVKAGSAAFTLTYATTNGTALNNDMVSPGSSMTLANNDLNFTTNDTLVIADCGRASIFKPSSISGNTINIGTNLNARFVADGTDTTTAATVHRLVSNTYFVAENNEGIPALYRVNSNTVTPTDATADELIAGVESIQLAFGVVNGAGNRVRYYTSTEDLVTDGITSSDIVNVRIALIVRSEEAVLSEVGEDSFSVFASLNGVDESGVGDSEELDIDVPQDRILRKVFSSTVRLRNNLM